MKLLSLERVEIGYTAPILPPIDLSITSGDLVGILGPNGAGKSTLLGTLLGLLPPLGGRVQYPTGHRPRVGYVPQAHRADPAFPLSALQVTLMGRYPRIGVGRRAKAEDAKYALAQLEAVGMASEAGRPFRALSGGQRQRVLVARAPAAEPELLVLDEPTSEMDPAAEHGLLSLVSRLATGRGVAVVFVTHEISAAASFARTLALVDRARGYFEMGPTEQLLTSEKLSRLYGRPVEVRREGGRTLVWMDSRAPEPGEEVAL